MKKFNTIEVHWKIQFLGGGWGHKKPIYRGVGCLKPGLAQFLELRVEGSWQKRIECFQGGFDTPIHYQVRFYCFFRRLMKYH